MPLKENKAKRAVGLFLFIDFLKLSLSDDGR